MGDTRPEAVRDRRTGLVVAQSLLQFGSQKRDDPLARRVARLRGLRFEVGEQVRGVLGDQILGVKPRRAAARTGPRDLVLPVALQEVETVGHDVPFLEREAARLRRPQADVQIALPHGQGRRIGLPGVLQRHAHAAAVLALDGYPPAQPLARGDLAPALLNRVVLRGVLVRDQVNARPER